MKEITISKAKLQEMYDRLTTKEMMEELNICSSGLYKMINAAGLIRKKPGFKRGENVKYKIVD